MLKNKQWTLWLLTWCCYIFLANFRYSAEDVEENEVFLPSRQPHVTPSIRLTEHVDCALIQSHIGAGRQHPEHNKEGEWARARAAAAVGLALVAAVGAVSHAVVRQRRQVAEVESQGVSACWRRLVRVIRVGAGWWVSLVRADARSTSETNANSSSEAGTPEQR